LSFEQFTWFFVGAWHSVISPDTSFITLYLSGISKLQMIVFVAIWSTLGTTILFFLIRSVVKISNRISIFKKIKASCHWLIQKGGYTGLIIVTCIPIIPGLRETSLAVIEIESLSFGLPIILFFNIVRIAAWISLFYNNAYIKNFILWIVT
jgi:hypothetical protein